ncbi:MAG: DUF2029 domain-containing protein [Chloroflexota bacterium]|nr:DUF2029 domain-containing protein [Chloroflexota bacterium]
MLVWILISWDWFARHVITPQVQEDTWPYSGYWVASRLALEGRADVVYREGPGYLQEIDRLNVSGDMLEVNVPATLLPFLPLSLLPIAEAFRVWTVVSLACFGLGWVVLLRVMRLPLLVALLFTAALPFFEPFSQNIRGQAYLVLFSLVTLSAVCSVTSPASTSGVRHEAVRRQVLGGLLLGVAAVFKLYYGLVLAISAAVNRRWIYLATAGLVVVMSALLTVLAWGTGIWERAIYLSLTWRERPETVQTAYQTTHSLLARLFRYNERWNPAPVADLPWLTESLWWLVTLSTVGLTILALWRSGTRRAAKGQLSPAWQLLAPCAPVPVASALAPIAEGYHYALCLFPILVVTAVTFEAWRHQLTVVWWQGREWSRGLPVVSVGLVLGMALLGAPWQYNVARVDGWASLLHYPRLYGGLLLWLLVVVLLVRPGTVGSVEQSQPRITLEAAP